MATEEKIILTADVADAAKTIGDLKNEIKDLKKALDGTVVGTEEYNETLAELQKQQTALKAAMAGSVEGFNSIQNATEGTAKSYNSLVNEMAKLKAAWRASTDEMERADIGNQINDINDQLKALDASTGNYQRNVGNYAGGFTQALQNISDKVKALQNPLDMAKGGVSALSGAFKALIANPIGAVIAALGVAIAGIVEGFKSSETATRSLQRAFAAFEPVINMIKNAFAYLAEGIGVALEYAGKFVSFIAGSLSPAYKEAQAESQALIEAEQALIDRRRKFTVEEARLQNQISELRNKAAQKDKYNATERKKYLSEAIELERKIGAEQLAIAQEQFDIDKRRADQAPNDAAANNKLSESEANLYRTKKQVNDKTRELNAQLAELNNQTNAVADGGVKNLQKAMEKADDFINNLKVSVKDSNLKEAMPDFTTAYDDANKFAEALKAVKEAELFTGTDEDRKQNELVELQLQYEEKKALATQFGLDMGAITEEYSRREYEIQNKYTKLELKKKEEALQKEKELKKSKLNVATQFYDGTMNLMNSLAALYEADTDASEEELQKAKNLKIAGAVMSTIEGAVNAYMSGIASGIPSPGNMILAVMQAATATAAGMANVRQLASTDVSKDSSSASVAGVSASGMSLPSSSGAVTQAPALDTVIESVRTVTTASEEESLNRSQKVYLVTDELEMAQNARKVRMAESTF